jgi:ABC-2 type transport system permease protein
MKPARGAALQPAIAATGLRWFAEYQPFTPIIETLRSLLMDKPLGNNAWIALVWCALIAMGGYLRSKKLFNREFSR